MNAILFGSELPIKCQTNRYSLKVPSVYLFSSSRHCLVFTSNSKGTSKMAAKGDQARHVVSLTRNPISRASLSSPASIIDSEDRGHRHKETWDYSHALCTHVITQGNRLSRHVTETCPHIWQQRYLTPRIHAYEYSSLQSPTLTSNYHIDSKFDY